MFFGNRIVGSVSLSICSADKGRIVYVKPTEENDVRGCASTLWEGDSTTPAVMAQLLLSLYATPVPKSSVAYSASLTAGMLSIAKPLRVTRPKPPSPYTEILSVIGNRPFIVRPPTFIHNEWLELSELTPSYRTHSTGRR